MNNLTFLFPPNYKNLEQKDAIALLEKIEKAVEEMDKGCDICTGEIKSPCNSCKFTPQTCHRCEQHVKYTWQLKIRNRDAFCRYCGKDLRKEEL